MGLWGVIRQRSCRQVLERRPMSGSDSHTFLELGPGLCKRTSISTDDSFPGQHKSKSHERILGTTLPYLSLDEESGNMQAIKTCLYFKLHSSIFYMSYKSNILHLFLSIGDQMLQHPAIKRNLCPITSAFTDTYHQGG